MNQDVSLTERQQRILQAVVKTHITTAEAVGSRTVAKRMGFKLSPATVRNVMADLEEMGYVRQPHTSAGRVPTDSGYRVYVDTLMEIYEVDPEEQQRIEELYRPKVKEIEELMELSSGLLSILTHYIAVVQTPKIELETIKHVELVPLFPEKMLIVLVTSIGDVRKRVAVLPQGMTEADVKQLTVFLNEKLYDLSFVAARSLLDWFNDPANPLDEKLAQFAVKIMGEILGEAEPRGVYLDGMGKIFEQPEFRNVEQLRPVLRVLDEKRQLNDLLEWCLSGNEITGVCIRIGSENPLDDVRNCSIVVSPYRVCGRPTGAIGVIGPTRMEYSRASSLVAFVADKLGQVLTLLSGGE